MIKRYFQYELDRWNRHPYLYTALTLVCAGYYVWAIARERKLQAEIRDSL